MFKKSIDYGKCTRCMACENICTNSRVITKDEQGYPVFKYEHRCISCGHCLAVCPQRAIVFASYGAEEKAGKTYVAEAVGLDPGERNEWGDALFTFLGETRSNRLFLDTPVEKEKIEKVLDIMARAPSAGNEQNRNFFVLQDAQKLAALEEMLKAYFQKALSAYKNPVMGSLFAALGAVKMGKEGAESAGPAALPFRERYRFIKGLLKEIVPEDNARFTYLKKAQALVLVTLGDRDSRLHRSFYKGDACIAATYGILMAKALGLASCWMGLLEIAANKDPKIRNFLNIPKRIDAAFVLGYSDVKWYQLPPRGPVGVTWL